MYSRLYHFGRGGFPNLRGILTRHRSAIPTVDKKDLSVKIKPGKAIHGFVCTDVEPIKEYNMTAYLFTHEKTKSQYLHLDRDDSNNVFCVGFRTTPKDSSGVAHILEHTVLCGSEKYPIRDPFFKMLNRSLATFMNAMTGPDYTFYPFSSQNEIDYRNLQKVYLDAVFKPNLSYLDFLQEGWRLEHIKLEDKSSDMHFKGVVYNEMKGAFSETGSLFGQKFVNAIIPEGPYSYVSGGDPLHIPNLTHADLKKFHGLYYHPSNAKIYSYGNFPVDANLKFLNEEYLSKYDYLDPQDTIVNPQPRWSEPRQDNATCRVDQYGVPVEKQNQIAIGYLMSDVTDINETFLLTALADLMIVGPNSAFYKSLIEKDISGGYTSLAGYDSQIRDTLFAIGLRDVNKEKFDVVTKIVNETIEQIHKKGFETDHIESVLHSFELSTKHQSPKFGLVTLFNLMPLWNHNGDIISYLKVNNLLDDLKKKLKDPNCVKNAIEKYFINNKHKLTMTLTPDPKFDNIFNDAEAKLLKSKVEKLTPEEKEQIYEDGIELAKSQKKTEDLNILPCLKIDEITVNKTAPALKHTAAGTVPLQLCEANTNGVSYLKGIVGTDCLNEEQRILLPFFKYILGKFDTKNYDYRKFDQFLSRYTSGLSVVLHITDHIDLPSQYEQGLMLASHSLDENLPKMLHAWTEIFNKPNFSNGLRMNVLLNNYCSSLTSGIIDSGHTYAMQVAKSLVSPVEECKENLNGLRHITHMQHIQNTYKIDDVQRVVSEIGDNILKGSNLRTTFHYSPQQDKNVELVSDFLTSLCQGDNKELNRINWTDWKKVPVVNRGMHISMNIPVNFCAKVVPTISYTDPDFAKLRVLSRFITSKYLHPVVREQNGAYGGGATVSMDGLFNFYSYRDPNSTVTMNVFDGAADWMKKNAHLLDDQNLFEAKLSILQQMDQPLAEYMKGVDLFCFGLSYDIWKTQRARVLEVTRDDLFEACEKYLGPKRWAGRCIIGDSAVQMVDGDVKWEKVSGPQQDTEVKLC